LKRLRRLLFCATSPRLRGTFSFVLLSVLFASTAWAGSPSSRLVYARGAGAEKCPDEDAFRKEVAARLGYDPFFPYASRTVSVEIELAREHGSARVVFVDDKSIEQGAQTIDGTSCESLVRAAALAVSVSLETLAPDPVPADPPSDEKNEIVATAPTPEVIVLPTTSTRTERREAPRRAPAGRAVGFSVAPELWGGFGQWPVATFGVGAALELRHRAFGVALEGRWDVPAAVDFPTGASASVERATGSLVPCGHFGVLALCGVVSLGDSWATGVDVSSPRTASAFYAAFGGRVGLDVPIGSRFRWSVVAQAAGIATPMHIQVGTDHFDSGPVDATFGSSIAMSIF
jgi:hypothetical protein